MRFELDIFQNEIGCGNFPHFCEKTKRMKRRMKRMKRMRNERKGIGENFEDELGHDCGELIQQKNVEGVKKLEDAKKVEEAKEVVVEGKSGGTKWQKKGR